MTAQPYPVLEERPLSKAKRRFLSGGRRDAAEIPTQRPGTVLVFEVDGHHRVLADRRHLSGSESDVVDAVSVSVVDIRRRLIEVDLPIPSKNAADDFVVRAGFECKVVEPDVVAAAGLSDVTVMLRNHIGADRALRSLGVGHRIDEVNAVREMATAQIQAICAVRPPRVTGMTVALAAVDVLTPADLRKHGGAIRDEEWRHDLERLRRLLENEDVERIAAMNRRGPEELEALGVSRGQVNLGEAAQRGYDARDKNQTDLLQLVNVLADRGHLDRIGVDPQYLVDRLSESLAGPRPPSAEAIERGAVPRRPSGALYANEKDRDDEVPDVVDEDELSD